MPDEQAPDAELFASLSERLRDAHRRIANADLPDAAKAAATRRLLAVTTAAKHDLSRAARRLDLLLADFDAGRYDVDDRDYDG